MTENIPGVIWKKYAYKVKKIADDSCENINSREVYPQPLRIHKDKYVTYIANKNLIVATNKKYDASLQAHKVA